MLRVELMHDFGHVLAKLRDALVHVLLRRLAHLSLLDLLTDWLHLYKNQTEIRGASRQEVLSVSLLRPLPPH